MRGARRGCICWGRTRSPLRVPLLPVKGHVFTVTLPPPFGEESCCFSQLTQHRPQGTGYWAFELSAYMAPDMILAFDANTAYPPSFRYVDVSEGSASFLQSVPPSWALLLAWPDDSGGYSHRDSRAAMDGRLPYCPQVCCALGRYLGAIRPLHSLTWWLAVGGAEASRFGLNCVQAFTGDTIFHVGETVGDTRSSNPWGQVGVVPP